MLVTGIFVRTETVKVFTVGWGKERTPTPLIVDDDELGFASSPQTVCVMEKKPAGKGKANRASFIF